MTTTRPSSPRLAPVAAALAATLLACGQQPGKAPPDVGRELLPLAAFFAVTLLLAIARFRKRLD